MARCSILTDPWAHFLSRKSTRSQGWCKSRCMRTGVLQGDDPPAQGNPLAENGTSICDCSRGAGAFWNMHLHLLHGSRRKWMLHFRPMDFLAQGDHPPGEVAFTPMCKGLFVCWDLERSSQRHLRFRPRTCRAPLSAATGTAEIHFSGVRQAAVISARLNHSCTRGLERV